VPLIVSLVALGGVVFSTLFTSWRNRIAEDKRADTTIKAEDRRARAAIEAENLRHEHALEAERRRHVLTTRHDFYLALSAANEALDSELVGLLLALDEPDPPSDPFSDRLDEVVDRFSGEHDRAALYASKEVDRAAELTFISAVLVEQSLSEPWPDARAQVKSTAREARNASARLKERLRKEVGADDQAE
jgi:hypothetical protein